MMTFLSIAFAAATCAGTRPELERMMIIEHGEKFAQVLNVGWVETTADDGKPLVITVKEQNSKLYFTFDKTKEGIWAEGPAQICHEDDEMVLKVSGKDIKLGTEAPWPLRISMSGGTKLRLKFKDTENLHVSATGWSGDFRPTVQK
jgi:hypothetical protein